MIEQEHRQSISPHYAAPTPTATASADQQQRIGTGLDDQSQLNALLSLIWRLPPQHTYQDVTDLARLIPDEGDAILQRVQRPSILILDSITKEYFLGNTFNKIAHCYRSCLSDKYFTKDGKLADSEDLHIGSYQMCSMRPFENALLEAMRAYGALRYPSAVTSVYVWNFPQQDGFAVAVLFKNTSQLENNNGDHYHQNNDGSVEKCIWDTIHVVHVTKSKSAAYYKLKSTAFLTLEITSPKIGSASWGGRIIEIMEDTRFIKDVASTSNTGGISSQFDFHIPYIGESIEAAETSISNRLKEIALPRTRETLCTLRLEDSATAQWNLEINRQFTETLKTSSANINSASNGVKVLNEDSTFVH